MCHFHISEGPRKTQRTMVNRQQTHAKQRGNRQRPFLCNSWKFPRVSRTRMKNEAWRFSQIFFPQNSEPQTLLPAHCHKSKQSLRTNQTIFFYIWWVKNLYPNLFQINPPNSWLRFWAILSLQIAPFYGFDIKNVRFPIGERTVSISRTYGFDMETVKWRQLKTDY